MSADREGFRSVTVFLLATNEVKSLRDTVAQIFNKCRTDDIERVVIVLKDSSCASSSVAARLSEENDKVEAYVQKSKNLHYLVSELAAIATGTHFIIMSSDGEMDTDSIPQLIDLAKKKPCAIICASKWIKGSDVHGYGLMRQVCNRGANCAIRLISGVKAYDVFSSFQIYPISVYRQTKFSKPYNLYYEWILLPVKNGVEYIEIPTTYRKRTEGSSNTNWRILFEFGFGYVGHAIRLRFSKQ